MSSLLFIFYFSRRRHEESGNTSSSKRQTRTTVTRATASQSSPIKRNSCITPSDTGIGSIRPSGRFHLQQRARESTIINALQEGPPSHPLEWLYFLRASISDFLVKPVGRALTWGPRSFFLRTVMSITLSVSVGSRAAFPC